MQLLNAVFSFLAQASVLISCLYCYASGDYSDAIETLLTAIAVIKQSRVANDERCRVLISSLKDCLHGIEAKSYSMGTGGSSSSSR